MIITVIFFKNVRIDMTGPLKLSEYVQSHNAKQNVTAIIKIV